MATDATVATALASTSSGRSSRWPPHDHAAYPAGSRPIAHVCRVSVATPTRTPAKRALFREPVRAATIAPQPGRSAKWAKFAACASVGLSAVAPASSSPAAHHPARAPATRRAPYASTSAEAARQSAATPWSGRRSRVPVARNEPAYTNGGIGGFRSMTSRYSVPPRPSTMPIVAIAPSSESNSWCTNPGRWTTNAPTTIAAAPSAVLVASGWRRRPAVSSAVIVPREDSARGTRRSTPSARRRPVVRRPGRHRPHCVLPGAAGRGRQPRRPGVALVVPGAHRDGADAAGTGVSVVGADCRRRSARRRSRTSRPSAASTSMNGAASTRKRLFSR